MIKSFEGKKPKIAKSAFISEDAYIIGDVEIGENSGVWPGAVIRGDFAKIRIGNNTMIEDNCVVHSGVPMKIGDNVIIGHGVIVHGIKIGNNNLIGSNATLLDNSVVGNFCIIGANCLVSQGMVIPDNSMVVGVPGKVVRKVPKERLSGMEPDKNSYSKLVRRYRVQQELCSENPFEE